MNGSRNTPRAPVAPRRFGFLSAGKSAGDPLQERIDCLIGQDTHITGDVTFSGGLRIDGQVLGDVTVSSIDPGTLVIGEDGVIQGDVRVSHLIVYGQIRGTVHAAGLVELRPSARILGDLHYQSLEMHAGAVIEGYLIKRQNADPVQ